MIDQMRRTRATRDAGVGPLELTVVMPCLNEAKTVGRCVEKARRSLDNLGILGEVIVADNGSTDGSPELATTCGARVVIAERAGYGAALQAGIDSARGRYVIMGDADDSYDFTRLGPFVERLRGGDDLVMGNRFRGGILPGAMPWHHRYIGNPVLTGILNLFFRSPIGDAHCGLRGFRRESFAQLNATSSGMEFASEMVIKACLHRQKISEVPVILHPDGRDRPPHLRSFRDGWRHLRLLLLFCPTWLYLVPSIVLLAFGLGLMAWLTPGWRHLGGVELGAHTMILGALLVMLGHQLAWTWAHAKIHGSTSGLLPAVGRSFDALNRFRLEFGLLLGLGLFLVGLTSNLWLAGEWTERGFGALEQRSTLRYALWGMTAMVLGSQVISGSFLLGMLRIGAGTMRPSRTTVISRN